MRDFTRLLKYSLAVSVLSVARPAFSASIDICADAPTPALHIFACTAAIEASAGNAAKVEVAYINRGLAYFATNELPAAVADFSSAIAMSPQDAKAYEARAIAYAAERKYDQAIADNRMAIEIDPLSTRAYNNLANELKAQGKTEDAIANYDRAIVLAPNEPALYFNRGKALKTLGRLK